MGRTLRVALVQLDAGADVDRNIARAAELTEAAAAALRPARSGDGPCLVALPEYLQYRGDDDGFRASAHPIPGPHTRPFGAIARRHGTWVLLGSLAEATDDPRRPHNTSVLLDPEGEVAATYRKIHLFDIAVDRGPADTESARVSPGDRAVLAHVGDAVVGLTICYDLRFPELYRALALAGAEVLAVPANFTERTGRDHWEVLLRARAIENGAFVLAPSQVGGPPGSPAFGRSLVVDPWGTVIAQAPDAETFVTATLDLDRAAAVRRQIPALEHRVPDAYDHEAVRRPPR